MHTDINRRFLTMPVLFFALLSAISLSIGACAGGPDRASGAGPGGSSSTSDRGGDDGADRPGRSANQASGESEPGAGGVWTILLGTYTDQNARERAERSLEIIRNQGGLRLAYMAERRDGYIVGYGSYQRPDTEAARADLARIRAVRGPGGRPFANAFFVPRRMRASMGNMPQLNLQQARAAYGDAAKYTLQVAVYESEDRREAMRKAEQAAAQLRSEGERAFYYHGSSRSMVTIGVFDDDDFDPETGEMSPELMSLRERHPYNLLNGMGIKERGPGGRDAMQRSALVQIP